MGGPSLEQRKQFPATRLLLGVVGVTLVAAAAVRAVPRRADLGTLVYASRGAVVVRDLRTGLERREALPDGTRDVDLAPDGTEVAAQVGAAIVRRNLRTGRTGRPVDGTLVGWAPDGRVALRQPGRPEVRVMAGDGSATIVYIGEDATAQVRVLWLTPRALVVSSTFEGDSSTERFMETVRAWPDGPRVVHRLKRARALAVSPDGREVLFLQDKAIKVLRVSDFTSRTIAPVPLQSVYPAAPGPRGVALLVRDAVMLVDPGMKTMREVARVRGASGRMVWARDGSTLLVATGRTIEAVSPRGDVRTIVRRDAVLLGLLG